MSRESRTASIEKKKHLELTFRCAALLGAQQFLNLDSLDGRLDFFSYTPSEEDLESRQSEVLGHTGPAQRSHAARQELLGIS